MKSAQFKMKVIYLLILLDIPCGYKGGGRDVGPSWGGGGVEFSS